MEQAAQESVARTMYAALDGRQPSPASALLDDASCLHVDGRSGLAGDYQGRDAILHVLHRMAELSGGSLHYGACTVAAVDGSTVILRGAASGARAGRVLDSVAIVEVDSDAGMVRDVRVRHGDLPAWDAFWAPTSTTRSGEPP